MHPNFLPPNLDHLTEPSAGVAAKNLGLEYAPAMVGFEFKERRCYPVLEGIVCFRKDKSTIIDAAAAFEFEKQRKLQDKKSERSIKNWSKLCMSLMHRERLFKEYLGK